MTLVWIICNKKSVVCTSSKNYEKNWHSYWVISNQWYEMCLTLPLNERELMFLLPCKEEWVISRLHFSLLFLLYIIFFPLLKNCLLLQVTVTFRCYVSGIYGSKVRKSRKNTAFQAGEYLAWEIRMSESSQLYQETFFFFLLVVRR